MQTQDRNAKKKRSQRKNRPRKHVRQDTKAVCDSTPPKEKIGKKKLKNKVGLQILPAHPRWTLDRPGAAPRQHLHRTSTNPHVEPPSNQLLMVFLHVLKHKAPRQQRTRTSPALASRRPALHIHVHPYVYDPFWTSLETCFLLCALSDGAATKPILTCTAPAPSGPDLAEVQTFLDS